MSIEKLRETFPENGDFLTENDIVRLCVISLDEKEDYIDVSYENSLLKFAFKDEQFLEDLWESFLDSTAFVCSIYDRKTDKFVGYCSIKDLRKSDWELAIELKTEACHKGYGTAALSIFMEKVYELTGISNFRTRVNTDNIASQRMMRRLNAHPNGVSEFLLRGEDLIQFQEENKDLIDENLRLLANEFNLEPEYMLGRVLEYRIDINEKAL